MRAVILFLAVLAAPALHAAEPLVLQIDEPGVFLFDPDSQTLVRVNVIKPTGTPPPPPVTTLQADVAQWTRAVGDAKTSQDLAIGYAVLLVRSYPDTAQGLEQVKADLGSVTRQLLEGKQAWQAWRDNLSARLLAMVQEGKLQSVQDYKRALEQIRAGLMDGAGAKAEEAIDFAAVIAVVQSVLQALGDGEITAQELLSIVSKVMDIFGIGQQPALAPNQNALRRIEDTQERRAEEVIWRRESRWKYGFPALNRIAG